MAAEPFRLGDQTRLVDVPQPAAANPPPAPPPAAVYAISFDFPRPSGVGKRGEFPFRDMKPGASFFAAVGIQKLSGAAHYYGKQHNLIFVVRTCTENGVAGARCWLIGPKP